MKAFYSKKVIGTLTIACGISIYPQTKSKTTFYYQKTEENEQILN